jgi:hypothetical protein
MSADLATQIARLDTTGFQQTLDEILAGESAPAYGSFQFPLDFSTSGASGSWSLMDNTGAVYSSAPAQSLISTSDAFSTCIQLTGLIVAPSALPPSSTTVSYQLRWELTLVDGSRQFAFNALKVLGLTSSPTGPVSTVEIEGDKFTLNLVSTTLASATVTVAVYGTNNTMVVANPFDATGPVDVAGGYLYSTQIDPMAIGSAGNPLLSSLDPYMATWKVPSSDAFSVSRHVAELFIVNSSILSAVEDVRRQLMKARTTQFGFDDTLFTPTVILAGLRRGRDMFNSASGLLTEFSMTNATGGIREFWVRYSEVAMLLAQSLAEGEKAFNFSGSAISLEVDKSQVYQSMADNLQSRLDQDIKPFKANLIRKGVVAGDGNMAGAAMSASSTSRVGLSVHPASQLGRYWRSPWL